ncbi:MAG: hypothetical protein JWR35_3337 [Marmoricola sp.]|jgi:hypothetical protein|nr:hypothetical protein [Marmoricola sp.]
MCTYVTEQAPARGSGKGAAGWFPLTGLAVYFDHPVHAEDGHTLNIDFANPTRGASSRVAVELSAATAVDLVQAIAKVFAQVPADLTGVDPEQAARLLEAARALVPEPVS